MNPRIMFDICLESHLAYQEIARHIHNHHAVLILHLQNIHKEEYKKLQKDILENEAPGTTGFSAENIKDSKGKLFQKV